ncbi:MAG: hypothetical protein L0154_21870 [Chloroflexi bacterium]|nr:hypothetical protein [Chloroflexota bacterium]
MKFEPQLLTTFREHFVADLDRLDGDFFSTYRYLEAQRTEAVTKKDLGRQGQIYTLLGMLEEYRKNMYHSMQYFQLANDIFKRTGDEDGISYTDYKMGWLAAGV